MYSPPIFVESEVAIGATSANAGHGQVLQSKPGGDKGKLMPVAVKFYLLLFVACVVVLLIAVRFGAVECGDKGYIQGRLGLSRNYDRSMAAWAKEPLSKSKNKTPTGALLRISTRQCRTLIPNPHISLGLGTPQKTVS